LAETRQRTRAGLTREASLFAACRETSAPDLSSAGRHQDEHENEGEGGKAKAQLQEHVCLLSGGALAAMALTSMIA
jgi:hypothetical protein